MSLGLWEFNFGWNSPPPSTGTTPWLGVSLASTARRRRMCWLIAGLLLASAGKLNASASAVRVHESMILVILSLLGWPAFGWMICHHRARHAAMQRKVESARASTPIHYVAGTVTADTMSAAHRMCAVCGLHVARYNEHGVCPNCVAEGK